MTSDLSPQFDPVPVRREDVLDVGWLSSALSTHHDGCRVSAVAIRARRTTVASKDFVDVDFANPGSPPAPGRLCIKAYFGESRALSRAGESEARFYRDCAPSTATRIPACSYVGLDEVSGSSILILEDLEGAGATPLDALSRFTPELSAATLGQLARRHAETWEHAGLYQPWLAPRMLSISQNVSSEQLQTLLDRPRADGLSVATRTGSRVRAAMQVLGHMPEDSPRCMLHGDTHAGNIFDSPSGPGLLDWQLVQRGFWATDVAYHIGSVLETEDRRRSEWELLRGYLDCLGELGVAAPPWESAVTAYRQQLAYGLFLWAMTQYTPEELTTATLQRLGRAVEDHGTFELLGV
ncbi:MAG TPA: phosphotransferase [Acidimicrobiales bacterium]|nr:phosphotransferase [Acidimicrobiales bacterium]